MKDKVFEFMQRTVICTVFTFLICAGCSQIVRWVTGKDFTTVLRKNLYANSAIVVELDAEHDTVVCEDYNAHQWVFYGVEDWCVGDGVSLVMNDNGTPQVYDDEIVTAQYSAWNFSR